MSDSRKCDCPCHLKFKGVPGEGYTYMWDDDRGIRHEDWINCRCGCGRNGASRLRQHTPPPVAGLDTPWISRGLARGKV